MKKFKVWLEENNCAIVYGNNISEIMSLYKNKKIEEYDDFYYLTFIEKIISSSKLVCKTTEYKIYKFYIQDGFILIKLFLENSVYLDVAYVQLKTKTHNDNTWIVERKTPRYLPRETCAV